MTKRSLIFCETCRYSAEEKLAPDGRSGGEVLAEHARRLLAERERTNVGIAFQRCLWSCKRHCNVLLRDLERYSYLAGDFTPERTSAEALLDWFDLHGRTELGEVSFRDWPQGMRGHFIARIPPTGPLDQDDEDNESDEG